MRLALFQPDIPQNTGTLLRLGACLDIELDIIEPRCFSKNELIRSVYSLFSNPCLTNCRGLIHAFKIRILWFHFHTAFYFCCKSSSTD